MKHPEKESIEVIEIIKISIPVFLFFAGLLFNKLSERLKELRRIKDKEKYLLKLMRFLDEQIDTHLMQQYDYLARIKNPEITDLTMNRVALKNIQYLRTINSEDIYKIIVEKRRGKSEKNSELLQKTYNIIDYYEDVVPSLYKSVEKSLTGFDDFRKMWNEGHVETMNIYNKLLQHNVAKNIKKGEDPFLSGLNDIMDSFKNKYFRREGLTNLKIGYLNFVKPVKDYVIANSSDPRAAYFINSLEACAQAYFETMNLRMHQRRLFIFTTRDMLKIQRKLKERIREIESLKWKII